MEKGKTSEVLRRPQVYRVDGKYYYIEVPAFNEDKEVIYVFEFSLSLKKGPSRRAKVNYRAPGLGEPWLSIRKQAWRQAYAVWIKMYGPQAPKEHTVCNACGNVLEDNKPERMAAHKAETTHRLYTKA